MKPTLMMYVDGNNFYKNIAELYNVKTVYPNWKDLLLGIRDLIQEDTECNFAKAYYFSSLSDRNDNPSVYDGHKNFLNNLNKCSFIDVVIGKLKCVPKVAGVPIDKSNPDTFKHIEKNTDINMSNEMLISQADIIVILSADADFEDTIKRLKAKGKTVMAVAPIGSKTSHIKDVVGQENMIYLDTGFLDKYVKFKTQLPTAS